MPRLIAPENAGTSAVTVHNINYGGLTPVPQSGIAQLGQALESSSAQFGKIAQQLQDQQDDLDLANKSGEYSARIQALRVDLSQAPITSTDDLATRRKNYVEQASKIRTDMEEDISGRVKPYFRRNAARVFQAEGLNVHTDALKSWNNYQVASIHQLGFDASRAAAEAPSGEARDEVVRAFLNTVDGATARGVLSADQAVKLKEDFEQSALIDHMQAIARQDPKAAIELSELGVYDKINKSKRLQIVDAANAKLEHNLDKANTAYNNAIRTWAQSVQNIGNIHVMRKSLTPEWIEENRDALGDRGSFYISMLEQQSRGIKMGDPDVENYFREKVATATPFNAAQIEEELKAAWAGGKGTIGSENVYTWLGHTAMMQERYRREQEQLAENRKVEERRMASAEEIARKERELRERELRRQSLSDVHRHISTQFTTPQGASETDAKNIQAGRLQVLEEVQDLVNKGMDPREAYRIAASKGLARTEALHKSRVDSLWSRLEFKNKADLNAARSRIGEAKYLEQAKIMEELYNLDAEIKSLRERQRLHGLENK